MITNSPEVASAVEYCGVHRIFIDLEINGKKERQGHLNTVISEHSLSDISPVKKAIKSAELLVRINPYSNASAAEIDEVIARGADIIMLPMFKTISEIEAVGELIAGRVKFIPLVETIEASNLLKELDESKYVDEIHVGLNDLHLELGLNFMFELLEDDYLESRLVGFKKPFGIGGIAKARSGKVNGELVMAEHIRLGSQGVILSRAFHEQILVDTNGSVSFEQFKIELEALNNSRKKLLSYKKNQLDILHDEFCRKVKEISD